MFTQGTGNQRTAPETGFGPYGLPIRLSRRRNSPTGSGPYPRSQRHFLGISGYPHQGRCMLRKQKMREKNQNNEEKEKGNNLSVEPFCFFFSIGVYL